MFKWLFLGLTCINIVAILINKRSKKISMKRYYYRQSSMHHMAKLILPSNAELLSMKTSQYKKYIKNKTVKVLTTPDGIAYWVKDNKFFSVNVVDGEFDPTDGKEIDTDKLSKKEIDKLLLILDNLNKGI